MGEKKHIGLTIAKQLKTTKLIAVYRKPKELLSQPHTMSILQESNSRPPITATKNVCPPRLVVVVLLLEESLKTVLS